MGKIFVNHRRFLTLIYSLIYLSALIIANIVFYFQFGLGYDNLLFTMMVMIFGIAIFILHVRTYKYMKIENNIILYNRYRIKIINPSEILFIDYNVKHVNIYFNNNDKYSFVFEPKGPIKDFINDIAELLDYNVYPFYPRNYISKYSWYFICNYIEKQDKKKIKK